VTVIAVVAVVVVTVIAVVAVVVVTVIAVVVAASVVVVTVIAAVAVVVVTVAVVETVRRRPLATSKSCRLTMHSMPNSLIVTRTDSSRSLALVSAANGVLASRSELKALRSPHCLCIE
jgi:hypothetical protein